jgi:uncharacterized integral membrane protein
MTTSPEQPAQPDRTDDEPVAPAHGPRGRPKAAWTTVTIGVLVAVVLIVFIAQNTQKAEVSFLGWDGDVPLAVALLIAAVCGAAIVLLVGTVRIAQLRRAERRQRRRSAS